jgi:hypothetical protein
MLSPALVAQNRDAFVVDLGVETTVDPDAHRATSDLDDLDLGEQSEAERVDRGAALPPAVAIGVGAGGPRSAQARPCSLCPRGRSSTFDRQSQHASTAAA